MREKRKRWKKGMVLASVLCLLSGCRIADTPEDECIVRRRTDFGMQAKTVASGDGLTIASQVQAGEVYQKKFSRNMAEVQVQAEVRVPDGESFKIRKAKQRVFDQTDLDGWIRTLTCGGELYGKEGMGGFEVYEDEAEAWLQKLREELEQGSAVDKELLEEGVGECEQGLAGGWFEKEDTLKKKEWRLVSSESEVYGVLDEDFLQAEVDQETEPAAALQYDETPAAVWAEPETQESGERQGNKRQELLGIVDVPNEWASWAEKQAHTYVCSVLNEWQGEVCESKFSLTRKERYEYQRAAAEDVKSEVTTKTSRKEMRKAADALIKRLGLTELTFAQAEPLYARELSPFIYGTHFLEEAKAWKFSYTRKIDDLSVNYIPNTSVYGGSLTALVNEMYFEDYIDEQTQNEWYQEEKRRENGWKEESFSIIFDDEGLVAVTWENPCVIEKISEENVFLLPFSEITQIFERSFLEQAVFEIFSRVGMPVEVEIMEVRLGYMCRSNHENGTEAEVIPVWDFIGEMRDVEQYMPDLSETWLKEYIDRKACLMTINATDGTILGRGGY